MPHTPTFNGHIPNRPALAPRNKSSNNLPLSCLRRPTGKPLLLSEPRLGPVDFQSNRLCEDSLDLASSVVGLGIHCTSKEFLRNTTDEAENVRSVVSSHSRPVSPSGFHDILGHDREPLLDDFPSLFDSQLPTSWSFSSTRSELPGPNDSVFAPTGLLGSESLPDSAPWSLEPISTTAADEIAKFALDYMASGSDSSLSYISDLPSFEDLFVLDSFVEGSLAELQSWPVFPRDAREMHSVPNVQMPLNLDSWNAPNPFSVNPAEIMTNTLEDVDVDYSYIIFSPEPEVLCLPPYHGSDDLLPDDEPVHQERRSPNFNSDIYVDPNNAIATSQTGAYYHVYPVANRRQKEPSDYESSSPESSPFPSPRPCKRARKSNRLIKESKQKVAPITNAGTTDISLVKTEQSVEGELAKGGPAVLGVAADGINLGTPVFDAHRGVDLDDLKCKAARYRLRNPGREYDNTWLVSFAGKLSEQGELLDDFRCYILGCDQINKRRDHILIHVGGHLDQRPFQCSHCTSKFLRKNECKRHEMSHSGSRPFHCDQCPPGVATFVRQDLLKRHLKRTHGIESNKENLTSRPLKRARRL